MYVVPKYSEEVWQRLVYPKSKRYVLIVVNDGLLAVDKEQR